MLTCQIKLNANPYKKKKLSLQELSYVNPLSIPHEKKS